MRLMQYINEGNDTSKFLDHWSKIKKDCVPFLKELKSTKTNKLIFRGTDSSSNVFDKKKRRKDRYPKDMSQELHEVLDISFKKKLGWKARSEGVFAHVDKNFVEGFGEPYIIFPIGKYKYAWHPKMMDLYMYFEGIDGTFFEEEEYKEEYQETHGEESGKGVWLYNDKSTKESEWKHAKDVVINDPENYGEFKDFKLEWEPEISWHEWMKKREEKWLKVDLVNLVKPIVDGYNTNDMRTLLTISREPEVMFNVDYYYILDSKYEDLIIDAIYKNKLPTEK